MQQQILHDHGQQKLAGLLFWPILYDNSTVYPSVYPSASVTCVTAKYTIRLICYGVVPGQMIEMNDHYWESQ